MAKKDTMFLTFSNSYRVPQAIHISEELILILPLTVGILHHPSANAETQKIQMCQPSFYHNDQKHTSRVRRRKKHACPVTRNKET